MSNLESPPRGRGLASLILGERPPVALPAAAQNAVSSDRRASEILVCFAQFGAIAFFGAFYAITPKAFPASVPFEPVPWALVAYALFTGFRLWLAWSDRLTPVFLGLSIVVDIGVLMLTIWSFHLQYQMDAATYLKAPTLLYVFILIALRTLRFEAVYVILAGCAAILGWIVLVAYAIAMGGGMEVTRSFSEYVMSEKILIGAEVDKLISIAAVTAVLAVAVVRARRLMVRSAVEAHAAAALSRFLAPEVAGEIRRAGEDFRPGDAVMRDAAVMMLDLRSFTSHAAVLGPRATMALLAEFHGRIVPIVQDHGGAIDKYLGDGVMITFGAARPTETFAADALRALLALEAALEDWAQVRRAAGETPVAAGAAVTVGDVLFGVTGDTTRLEFTVIGTAVNEAAKIEKHSKKLGRNLIATRAALDLAAAQGFAEAGRFTLFADERVDGIAGPVDLVAA